MRNVALIHTTYLHLLLFKYACESSSLVSVIVVTPGLCLFVWGGDINIRSRADWTIGGFVSVLSNNIVWQKSLSAPLWFISIGYL